jgi:multidrug efflux pump subunit AcrB
MKIATIISTVLLVLWVLMTMAMMWTNSIDGDIYIKLTITMGIVVVATILIALALREYGTEKKLKDHNYLD